MNWEDVFKGYPKDAIICGLIGVIESVKISLGVAKNMDKEKYIKVMEELLKSVEKDLEDIKKKIGA